MLSGGGRDRRLVQWGPGLVALQEAEVRAGLGWREGGERGMVSGLLTCATILQIPEHFGAVRAIAEGLGSELLVGTTKNALLRGDLAQGFSPVIQVGGQALRRGGREELLGRARSDSPRSAAGPHRRALGTLHTSLPEPLPHLRP